MKKFYEVKANKYMDCEGKSVEEVVVARLHGTEEAVKAWAEKWVDARMAENYWWMDWSKDWETKRIAVEVEEIEVEEVE
jgi:hypothetical protein